jgi:predicted lipoprotein with Yx(FWY)xxD motif
MKRLMVTAVALTATASLAIGLGGALGASQSAGRSATLATAKSSLGRILVDAQGRTLYLFEKDKGMASSCYGACASVWPPLTTGRNATGAGLGRARLATSRRHDGKTEVTVDGRPVYTYAGDRRPGDVTGQGLDQFGAEWYALAPNGHKIDDES